MASTPQDPHSSLLKRKLCIGFFTTAMPTYFLFKNRMTIYKGSKLVREFYIKELFARTAMGFLLGVVVSTYFYGAGPATKKAIMGKDRVEIDGKEYEKSSLEFSVAQKKKFLKNNEFLPGKIRDD